MRPLTREEIAPLRPYAAVRNDYRRAVMAHKRDRRLGVGPSVTLLFEDRETLRFQVQEMLLVERVESPALVQNELDVYNELMPGDSELSATLMVEITEPGRIRAELDRLIGIDEHVSLELGEGPTALRVPAEFDVKQFDEERISAVQYIRFRLDSAARERFLDADCAASIEIDHPAYPHRSELPSALRASLMAGLQGEPGVLLPDLPEDDGSASREGVIFESADACIVTGKTPDSLTVESRVPLGTLDEAGWRALFDVLRRASVAVMSRSGSARIEAELHGGDPARWQVHGEPPQK